MHDTRAFGSVGTSLTVTALGFGATAIGGMYTEVGDDAAVDTVAAAWEAGLRYFDAAPQYGRGNGEVRLGRGLAGYPREDYVLSSKVGRLLRADAPPHPDDFDSTGRPYDAGAPGRRHRVRLLPRRRAALDRGEPRPARHRPSRHRPRARSRRLRRRGVGDGVPHADRVAGAEGVIRDRRGHEPDARRWNGSPARSSRTCSCWPAATRCWNRLRCSVPAAVRRAGIAVVAGGVFNSGLLADAGPGARYDYDPAPAEMVARAHRLVEVCQRHRRAPEGRRAAVPDRAHPAVVAVLTGARSRAEIVENARCSTSDPRRAVARIDVEGVRSTTQRTRGERRRE